jgi:hypothetical protein
MTQHLEVAVDFAASLVDGGFDRAYALLAPNVQQQFTSVAALRDRFYAMFRGYADGEARRIHYSEDSCWRDSGPPESIPREIGWALTGADVGVEAFWVYVSIEGDDFMEAVSVRVAEVNSRLLINEIEWGRP